MVFLGGCSAKYTFTPSNVAGIEISADDPVVSDINGFGFKLLNLINR